MLVGTAPVTPTARAASDILTDQRVGAVAPLASNRLRIAAELDALQAAAVQLVSACEHATIEYICVFGSAATPSTAATRIGHFRNLSAAMNIRLTDFFASARRLVSGVDDLSMSELQAFSCCASETKRHSSDEEILARLRKLTARQRRVVELIVQGLPNKVIAYELGITETTVKAHMGVILQKLSVSSRARVIALLANIELSAALDVIPRADKVDGK